jgi:hypothetical protein
MLDQEAHLLNGGSIRKRHQPSSFSSIFLMIDDLQPLRLISQENRDRCYGWELSSQLERAILLSACIKPNTGMSDSRAPSVATGTMQQDLPPKNTYLFIQVQHVVYLTKMCRARTTRFTEQNTGKLWEI